MRRAWWVIGWVLIAVSPLWAGSVMLGWDASTQNEDGSPLTDLAGYHLFHGLSSGVYDDPPMTVGIVTQASMGGLADGVTHYFAAKAFDSLGNESSTFSNEVSITLPAGDSTPPTVSITSPANGAMVPRNSNVTISATAGDDTGVVLVNFKVNGSSICGDNTSPYSCVWHVPAPPNRSYTLQATATDAAGNSGQSAIVTVVSQ